MNAKSTMHVIGAFKYSSFIELAIMDLENAGISKQDIIVVPFEWQDPTIPDSLLTHQGDQTGVNLVFIFGSVLMLLGSIYGFVLPFGPIFCSIIGLVVGGLIGYIADWMRNRRRQRNIQGFTEVIVIVKCTEESAGNTEQLLRQNNAFGVAKVR